MPEPQLRFLLRGSALLIVMLALWSLALRPPMLFLLRASESIALRLLLNADSSDPITVDAAGDWHFRVPIEDNPGAVPGQPGRVKFRAMEFTMARPDVALFTFSVPVFWAVVLATPAVSLAKPQVGLAKPKKRSWIRALLWGTALVSLVEVLSLLADTQMIAYETAAQLHRASGGLAGWSREFGTHLVVGVIPFAAPVLAGVVLNRDLRSQIFSPRQIPDQASAAHGRTRGGSKSGLSA